MSDKRKVRRVLVMIDYGEGDSANGEVFDLTALALEMAPHGNYGNAQLDLKVSADKTYRQAPEPEYRTTVTFGGYAGARFISGATHLDDVVNSALPDGERVKEIQRKSARLRKKMEALHQDEMVARLRQAAEIRHSHPIARFHEPLPELPPPAAPALTAGGAA